MGAQQTYYLLSAQINRELHLALADCKAINLTASNAQAACLRAGNKAWGFNALTRFINELASLATQAANQVNLRATVSNKQAINLARTEEAIGRFRKAHTRAGDAPWAKDIPRLSGNTLKRAEQLKLEFRESVNALKAQLQELRKELRTAPVLVVLARVEASRMSGDDQSAFSTVANTVEEATQAMTNRVDNAIKLFNTLIDLQT